MKLDEALQQIASATGLGAAALIAYAKEDQIGGRDTGNWPGMSIFAAEGQILYALARALKPVQSVEVGVDTGGTTTHLLTALEANNAGALYSVDINASCGIRVPEQLRSRWRFVVGDGLTVELPAQADFIFEDSVHSYDFTVKIMARLKALNPRVIVTHDYYSHEAYEGFGVKQAFDEVFPSGFGIKIDDAFTGLGIWVNPDYEANRQAPAVTPVPMSEPKTIKPEKPVVKRRVTHKHKSAK